MAKFGCPIEMEPRTLNQGLINHARELAVDIVQKNEPDEASTIFCEGLKPVIGIKEAVADPLLVSDANALHKCCRMEHVVKTEINVGTCCHCSCITTLVIEDQPLKLTEGPRVKEPLSAPF